MFKIILLALLSICLINCAKTEFDGVDPKIVPYIKELNQRSLEYTGKPINVSIPINFKKLSDLSGDKGVCHHTRGFHSSAWEIFIDPEYWDVITDSTRLGILLHEIGHCEYYKGHDDTRYIGYADDSFPNSIMTTDEISGNVFDLLEEHFFKEFQGVL